MISVDDGVEMPLHVLRVSTSYTHIDFMGRTRLDAYNRLNYKLCPDCKGEEHLADKGHGDVCKTCGGYGDIPK